MTFSKMASSCFAFIFISTFFILGSCSDDNGNDNLPNNQYLLIPDNHFEQMLIDQGVDSDGTLNGQMLREDAEQVQRLDLNRNSHFGEIADLTGIEGFSNITFLSAAGQNLVDIDLSSNTQLDTLYLQNNYLSTIDLSKNTDLIVIDVLVNELTTISGLEQATRLKRLNLSYNYFEDFSITNASIEHLLMSDNLLTSFDSTGAPNLKSILLTTNQLSTVDFSSNPSLETLVISNNALQNIGLENNPNLMYFYASSNQLNSLDVSQNTELIDLRVDRNPDLSCIKIHSGQEIPSVSISEYQELNEVCQ
ncbi:leucine-rich repeat domain-containing protein [Flagellimonas lutimaris]|uniref:leucine-rich repeat domain-containing protein n=1 Tax=Flagellimonas lutimaris TaxID=475082 RepID=UPI0039C142F9